MEVYDLAHRLAKALEESSEYEEFVGAKHLVEKDENNLNLLQDFRNQQLELQMAQLAGQEVSKEQVEHIERMYQMLSLNKDINEYLNAEYKLSRMMGDIQKILGDAVSDWFGYGRSDSNLN